MRDWEVGDAPDGIEVEVDCSVCAHETHQDLMAKFVRKVEEAEGLVRDFFVVFQLGLGIRCHGP